MLRILITGARNPASLELARLPAGSRTRIWLANSLRFPLGRFSRSITGYIRTLPVNQDAAFYVGFLLDTIRRQRIDLLIPTYEEIMYIARYRHRPEGLCEVFCDNLEQLHRQHSYPRVAQGHIRGKEYCSYSIAHHGTVTAHVTCVYPYSLGKGSGIYYHMVEQPPMGQFIRAFCRKHRYHGQTGMNFIRDEHDKKLYAIECKPLAVNGLHLLMPADQLLRAFPGEATATIRPMSHRKRMNAPTFATYNSLAMVRWKHFWQWCKDFISAKDVIFHWKDPLPMLTQNLTLLESF